jgi:succinate dehydrogenase/fumarate reductase flavoprotein subunit
MAGRCLVAGGGMAGLVAAARATELGCEALLYEKAAFGGSMVLSSGVVWRHSEWESFRAECAAGDAALQRLVWERLDESIEWLRRLGAPVLEPVTGNPLTTGVRFDPPALRDALLGRLEPRATIAAPAPLEQGAAATATILATGGFAASRELVARYIAPAAPLRRRGNAASSGDGLRHGLARGAALSVGMDEFYGRNMPDAPWSEPDYVPLAQLYARHARIFDATGCEFFAAEDVSWSETNVVEATARRPGACAYYLLDAAALSQLVRGRSVAEIVAAAPAPARVDLAQLPFRPPRGTAIAVRVTAAITHTIGGLRVDGHARVLDERDEPIPGLYAAGVDAGGVAAGGYASGLAQALVLGLAAAESVAAGL